MGRFELIESKNAMTALSEVLRCGATHSAEANYDYVGGHDLRRRPITAALR